MLENLFRRTADEAVLLNYTTHPFVSRQVGHSNYYEARIIARALHDHGYRVDILDFFDDTPVDCARYRLIFGFGHAFEQSFAASSTAAPRRIYYATGAHVSYQNPAEIDRVRIVNHRHGVRLMPQRVVPWCWSLSTSFSDALVVLGNDWTASTYRPFTDAPIHTLDATALFNPDADRIHRDPTQRPLGLLWFGARGFVHKGLDVCLEYAASEPDVMLHVCAAEEAEFMRAFAPYFRLPNVLFHGHVDVRSAAFVRIVAQCTCCILPSCSEGQSTSLLTAMATGLIPIGTTSTGVDIARLGILMDDISVDSVARSVAAVRALPPQEIRDRDHGLRQHCRIFHSPGRFNENVRALLARYVP
ncbi:MAG: glycosyltransferase [Planctomycetia bacterium]